MSDLPIGTGLLQEVMMFRRSRESRTIVTRDMIGITGIEHWPDSSARSRVTPVP